MSRKQPIVVYKYIGREIVLTKRFSNIQGEDGAAKWLRSQGCRFGTKKFINLGNDSLEFPVGDGVYFEAECDAAPSQTVRRRADGTVKD